MLYFGVLVLYMLLFDMIDGFVVFDLLSVCVWLYGVGLIGVV